MTYTVLGPLPQDRTPWDRIATLLDHRRAAIAMA